MYRIPIAFGTALLAGAAFAQTDFAVVDVDASGGASYEEVAAVYTLSEAEFEAADADMNGELDEGEYTVLAATLPQ